MSVARHIAAHSGMSVPLSAATALTVRRVVREYGQAVGTNYGRLSIAGQVAPRDVWKIFMFPHTYVTSIMYDMINRRGDMDIVQSYLMIYIERFVEAIPTFLTRPYTYGNL